MHDMTHFVYTYAMTACEHVHILQFLLVLELSVIGKQNKLPWQEKCDSFDLTCTAALTIMFASSGYCIGCLVQLPLRCHLIPVNIIFCPQTIGRPYVASVVLQLPLGGNVS